jgi:hypothetical protein
VVRWPNCWHGNSNIARSTRCPPHHMSYPYLLSVSHDQLIMSNAELSIRVGGAPHFPVKLHLMIEATIVSDQVAIIRWQPRSNSWIEIGWFRNYFHTLCKARLSFLRFSANSTCTDFTSSWATTMTAEPTITSCFGADAPP